MYYRIYKSRLLTAHQDGADWRVLLDEGYLTERRATPEMALDDAILWLECQAVTLGQRLARGLPDLTVNLYIYPTDAGGEEWTDRTWLGLSVHQQDSARRLGRLSVA
jgi:hypothetical protein